MSDIVFSDCASSKYMVEATPYLIALAGQWHGGQSSPLYSLASTGKLHGMAHVLECINETEQCVDGADDRADKISAQSLLHWLEFMRDDEASGVPTMPLDDFYRSDYFAMWDDSNRSAGSCGIILQDPDRYDRIVDAAGDGCEGSTHAEIIDDWRQSLQDSDLDYVTQERIEKEIEACEKWHADNGSLDRIVG